ncbi:MAG: RNA polymerase sigma factor [Bacteroidales bacterium]|nr:RNA polymerase sigma factor [Bacteroidales bacterium]
MTPDNKEILQIIKRCCKGDNSAKFKLYNLYVKQMYNTAIRFFNNQMIAEDIVQESFIAAFDNIKKFKGDSNFGAWLKRIVINKSITEIRKNRLQFEELTDSVSNTFSDNNIESDITAKQIHDAVKELPLSARTILNLYIFENYKQKEIAQMLDITESTSKTQYKRAKQILFNILKPAYYGTEV